ncbi:MAG: hypothetical protein M0R47_16755 [Methylobacter sp.]|uniref:hypothetical protein n=1 Tax=Methylobacter sp. TaxID=2051955 RepID=UPI0025E6C27C|nr:hypothetical protein [Methylobacter sp.]MCK9622173.1 hypothetical protein [Methylobacter sp.]
MKILITILAFVASATAQAESVRGYTRRDGTYVAPHMRSSPDSSRYNNYGSQTYGGSQRDEFSSAPAYNQRSSSYGFGDNDNDGQSNSFDRTPNNSDRW